MSVIALSSAPRCEVNDDCDQGEVCAFKTYAGGQEQTSHCLDCDQVFNYEKYQVLYESNTIFNAEGFMYHPSGDHIFFEVASR